ncbi:MAG: diguanylate cyclase [Actinomycetota bacterium]|nr:diguanylate cyclase [Actinomycetota bacterium]
MPKDPTGRPGKLRLDGDVWPFGAICLLALTATLLRTEGTDWGLVLVAGLLALSLTGAAALADRVRSLAAAALALPFAVDGILALLRQSQGGSTSGYAPLAILPVIWVGLTRGSRSVAAMTACTFAVFAVPILVAGAPLYPTTGWRSVVLWTIVAAAVGVGARRVVSEQRRLTAVADERAKGLDRLVTAQTAVSTADHDADAVMSTVAREAMVLVGSDAACVELLDGDEVVCTAGVGAAIEWVGLRLPADDSITGECFRTGKVLTCTDSEADSRVARDACRAVGARSLIVVPLTHAEEVKGVLIAWSATAGSFSDYQVQLLSLLANTSGAALDRAGLIAMLTEHAVTDELTGLPNRRAWNEHLEHALARSRRSREPVSVLLLDLNGFKAVNDRKGHAAGDQLLVAVSSSWRGAVRDTDVLGRLGGDEFGVVLERADGPAAAEVAARLQQVTPVPHTAAIGSAVWNGDESAAELLARADAEMYQHKAATRTA